MSCMQNRDQNEGWNEEAMCTDSGTSLTSAGSDWEWCDTIPRHTKQLSSNSPHSLSGVGMCLPCAHPNNH